VFACLLLSASLLASTFFNPTFRARHELAEQSLAEQSFAEQSLPERALPDSMQLVAPVGDSVLFGQLTDGSVYRRIRTASGAIVHVVSVDARHGITIGAAKARDSYDGLATLTEIYEEAERKARRVGDTVIAAINAGPWHPERLSPIGPLVVDGDVVELSGDDAWSSLLLYDDGSAAISRDRVSGQVFWRHRQLDIRTVDRRVNDESIVLYNTMYGEMVPGARAKSEREIIDDALATLDDDSGIDYGDDDVDTAAIVRAYRALRARDERERHAGKIAVRRLPGARRGFDGRPRLNDTTWTMVTMVDTGVVPIPHDGYVISLGTSEEWFHSARPGDTVRILFQAAHNGIGTLRSVVPGYPQLLFEGRPAAEPDFAQGPAAAVLGDRRTARTAVGISADGATVFLVAVDGPETSGRGGMTIDELTAMLRSLGAHDAVALEGRSSTGMVVNYDIVAGGTPGRRISNALIVTKKRQ
jgi:hypothetical protein